MRLLAALFITCAATHAIACYPSETDGIRQGEGDVASLKHGEPDVPDNPRNPGTPPILTAGTSAVCPKGVWQASTGNSEGECSTKSNSQGNTTHVHCSDGKGNNALVDCSKNSGVGGCNTQGAGKCEFKK